MVSLEDVVVSFGDLDALDHVSFDVEEGEIFGLLGHNGAGKTTLIRVVNGLLAPASGRVHTFGFDPVDQGEHVRARTGVLTEYPALDSFLTTMENVVVYAHIHGLDASRARSLAADLLERLHLTEHASKPAHALSAGLKQRVALARALVHRPRLLLLDEPTSNLDPIAALGVRELVHDLAREDGHTVVLSTHNLAEAQSLCDRVAILQRGRVLAVGSLGDLGQDLAFGRVCLGTVPDAVPAAVEVVHQINGLRPDCHNDEVTFAASPSAVEEIVKALVAAGVPVRSVVPQHPTLEDVYITLHEGAEHSDGHGSAGGWAGQRA